MKTLLSVATAILLTVATLPALAQSSAPSDRYTPTQPQAGVTGNDQQAQTPNDRRHSGAVENLRSEHMSSPNVKGQRVPENPETGAAAPELRGQPKQNEGVTRP